MGNASFIQLAIQMIDGMHDGAVLIDTNFNVIYANSNFYRMKGWLKKSYQRKIEDGLNHFHWAHKNSDEEIKLAITCIESKRPVTHSEIEFMLENDIEGICQLNLIPLLENDEVRAVALVYRNVTDETRLQKEYRSLLNREIERVNDLEKQVSVRTLELKKALDEVVQLSRIDPLTGLFNRRAFQESADPILGLIARHKRKGAIMMCDLDHFKKLNDTFGHQAGDVMLVEVAKALRSSVRKEDIVCRFGGEEFLVFLTEVKGGGIEITAKRCLEAVRSIPVSELIPGKIEAQTMSLGIALIPEHGYLLENLISKADTALYEAKRSGRNRFKVEGIAENP